MVIPEDVARFFRDQNFVIVSSLEPEGGIRTACKGIARIEPAHGRVYLLDLYLERTFRNLRRNPAISLTAVDEPSFSGYCIEGEARIIGKDEADPVIAREWEEKITARISQRLVRNLRGEKGHASYPEALLPAPKYIIAVDVKRIVDLTPPQLKA
ncbi:MAG: pyridoxamine 5'-phosphate oxidase family protein [Deltaproteobacteria bacterium]